MPFQGAAPPSKPSGPHCTHTYTRGNRNFDPHGFRNDKRLHPIRATCRNMQWLTPPADPGDKNWRSKGVSTRSSSGMGRDDLVRHLPLPPNSVTYSKGHPRPSHCERERPILLAAICMVATSSAEFHRISGTCIVLGRSRSFPTRPPHTITMAGLTHKTFVTLSLTAGHTLVCQPNLCSSGQRCGAAITAELYDNILSN